MADKSVESSRVVLAVACTLFIVHNVLFVVLSVRQFNEEKILRDKYQHQLDRIHTIQANCPEIGSQVLSLGELTPPSGHLVYKRQSDDVLQQMITSQELVLEKHCSNGTGFCVKGAKGSNGLRGSTGIKGSTGAMGKKGQQGVSGGAGSSGPQGVKGLQGASGDTGETGPKGLAGHKGSRGISGKQGSKGSKGDSGLPGPKGMIGPTGKEGVAGNHGVNGATGPIGETGEPGQQAAPGLKGNKGPSGTEPYVDPHCTCAAKPAVIGPKYENVTAANGGTLTLNCSISGSPSPKVTWSKVNSALPLGSEQHGTTLTVPSVSLIDAGEYKCHADNGIGEIEKSFNVQLVDLNCDFETDFCSWTQSMTDNTDWTYKTGGTPTSYTGPDTDHTKMNSVGNGYYVYMESSLGHDGDRAELLSPTLQSGQKKCFQFYYHMYGTDINALKILLKYSDGTEQEVWSKAGDRGNQWNHGVVNIPAQAKPYQIVIRSIRGKSIEGDIGLDDVQVNDGNCPLTAQDLDCNFERDMCYWQQSTTDQLDLTRQSGSTMTMNTGPSVDHTLKTAAGHYIYLESTDGKPGDTATVVSHLVKTSSYICFRLWYHMLGNGMGKLNIYVQMAGKPMDLIWTRNGPQGNRWNEAQFGIPAMANPFRIVVETEKGKNPYSDIAIDDISTLSQQCPDQASTLNCDFENGMCGWRQGTADNFDWMREDVGHLPAGQIKPSIDHTLQTGFGHCIYVDPIYAKDETTMLISPSLSQTTIYCLDFWYFLDSPDSGSILIRRTNNERTVETLATITTGSGRSWTEKKLNVASYWTRFNLALVGVRGQSHNHIIAVDDVRLTTGPCK